MTEQKEWLKVGEAAAILGVHVRTVRAWLKSGAIRGRKVGGIWLVNRDALFKLK